MPHTTPLSLICISIVSLIMISSGTLYGMSRDGAYFALNEITGETTFISHTTSPVTEIEYDCLNEKMYLTLSEDILHVFEMDAVTGDYVAGPVRTNGSFNGMEYVGSTLYASCQGCPGASRHGSEPPSFTILDPETGDFTYIAREIPMAAIPGLAYDINSNTMYGVTSGGAPSWLISIDLETGMPTFIGPVGNATLGSLQFGADGVLFAGGNRNDGGNIYTIDTETGAATFLAATNMTDGITGLALVYDCQPTSSPTASPVYSSDSSDSVSDSVDDSSGFFKNYKQRKGDDSSDNYNANALFGDQRHDEGTDSDKKSIVTMEVGNSTLFQFSAMMVILLMVNVAVCWCLNNKNKGKTVGDSLPSKNYA